MNCDIISIGETHLHVENVIDINGYRQFGFNRRNIHVNAPKLSRKGKYVGDYICAPIDVLRMITNFNVATTHTIVEEFQLHNYVHQ